MLIYNNIQICNFLNVIVILTLKTLQGFGLLRKVVSMLVDCLQVEVDVRGVLL
jgi:hypothetical protein